MPIYGYSKRVLNEYGLHDLSEVTFQLPTSDLRRVAAFLIACAEGIESGGWQSSHAHLTDHDRRWNSDHPHSDVIVIHPEFKTVKVIDG